MSEAFEGRVAMVTGTGRENGIGWAVAKEIGRLEGFVACGVRKEEEIAGVEARIKEAGFDGMAFELDYTNLGDFESITAKAEDRLSAIRSAAGDVPVGEIVHVAGATKDCPAGRTTEEEWDEVNVVKGKGAFFTTKAAIGGMRQVKPSRVVGVTSIVGPVVGNVTQSKYGAANGAMAGWLRCMAAEFNGRGVSFGIYAPGVADTHLTRGTMSEDTYNALLEKVPLGRAYTPDEVAGDLVDFMLSGDMGVGNLRIMDGGMSDLLIGGGSFKTLSN